MVRWRDYLVLTMLILLPLRVDCKMDEEDEDEYVTKGYKGNRNLKFSPASRRVESDDEDEDDDDEDDEQSDKEGSVVGHRVPVYPPTTKATAAISRTTKKSPLECYVCAYKSETPLRACLDPTKYRVNTITCHSVDDRCFTSVVSKATSYDSVVRGCRSNCVGSSETTCCDLNRCNNQAFAVPVVQPKMSQTSKSSKTMTPSVLFFVTILLLLQTVAKVAYF